MTTTCTTQVTSMAKTLQEEIVHYSQRGFHVTSQTERQASLVKPKKFSLFWFFVGFGILYLPFCVAKRDETLLLYIDDDGEVRRAGGRFTVANWLLRRYQGRA